MTTHPRRRLALALTLAAPLTLGAADPAAAAKPPSFLLTGGDHWFTHDVGYPVALGPAEVQLRKHSYTGDLAANIHPDDRTMPAPGECETATAFVFVEGEPGANTRLSSAGEVCGLVVQAPDSVVTHTFTGPMTIEESDRGSLEGKTGFLEIRIAENGRAHVFATTS
jgi:hypothetical protein